MRMRHKPNLDKRLLKCEEYMVKNPENTKGKWKEDKYSKLFLEIGCGKGTFTCSLAESEPDTLIVAIEKVPDAIVVAMEKADSRNIENVKYISTDAKDLKTIYDDQEVDRIYLNFSDPWPKSRDAKFRLTAPAFLRIYSDILPVGGQIRFKTDNKPLFDWSVEQFRNENWDLEYISYDHKSNIMTDYEIKFVEQGIKINGLTAIKTQSTKGTKDGVPERLRNAALSDARNC